MTDLPTYVADPKLDLELERAVDVPPHLVWAAWTRPEHIVHWFCPRPWQTTEVQVDLRPGGIFASVMKGPEGPEMRNKGCILEVIENERLVWTASLGPGFRPQDAGMLPFTAMILLEPHGEGTRYRAIVVHGTEESQKKHAEMGFHGGWNTALDQLVEYMKTVG